jgi:hypothetical protein
VREDTVTVEAARAVVAHVVETSAQEAAMTWDGTAVWVKHAEDRAALMEREAQERVSRVEEECTVTLASACEETETPFRKIALLEGELVEVCRAHKVTKETTGGLSAVAADVEQSREVSERGHGISLRRSPSCRLRAPSYALPLSVHQGRGITYRRGCRSLLSTTPRWPESLPRF